MDRATLERLASNPHYKMSQKQVEELARLRAQDVQHSQGIPKHQTGFRKHDPRVKKEGEGE